MIMYRGRRNSSSLSNNFNTSLTHKNLVIMRRVYQWFLPIVMMASILPDIRAQQIVAQYDFKGKANAVSGYANHATNHGAVLTADRFNVANNAFWFDGEMSYLRAPNAVQLQSPTTTVAFWVRVDEL